LKILPHKVYNDKKEIVELCSSVECKGIIGNDGRHYILDLLRTFPPDVNFLKCKLVLKIIEIELIEKLCSVSGLRDLDAIQWRIVREGTELG
jgi:protein TIF31